MIQRKQTIWLFLSALILVGMFFVPYYFANINTIPTSIGVKNDLPALILLVISIVLSLVTIFLYKSRKRQTGLILINIIVLALFLFYLIWFKIDKTYSADPTSHYSFGIAFPIISFVLLFFALVGVRKDEKLVKSLDRLR